MKPLLDGDVLRYEIGACGQDWNEDTQEWEARSWEFVRELLDKKIEDICDEVWATEPPTLFLTSCKNTHKIMYRKTDKEYVPNFREAIAVTKPYKATRKQDKPLHYDNITAYLIAAYDVQVAEGLEADDLLAVHQTKWREQGGFLGADGEREPTIICSRDKDLRMVSGYHYSWAVGMSPAFGPEEVDEFGRLEPIYSETKFRKSGVPELKKVVGTGASFFAYQLLVGDTVDNIPGLPRVGPVKAAAVLAGCETTEELLKAVRDAYKDKYGDDWEVNLLEQGRLLWMVTHLEEGKPVMWELPDYLLETDND